MANGSYLQLINLSSTYAPLFKPKEELLDPEYGDEPQHDPPPVFDDRMDGVLIHNGHMYTHTTA